MSKISKEIAVLLHGLNRIIQQQGNEYKLDVSDLTMLQMQALTFIKSHEKIRMGELADELGVTAASATSLVDRLIKAEWLERLTDPADRRHVHLALPEKRKQKLTLIMERKLDRIAETLEHLAVDDQQELHRILTLLTTLHTHLKI